MVVIESSQIITGKTALVVGIALDGTMWNHIQATYHSDKEVVYDKVYGHESRSSQSSFPHRAIHDVEPVLFQQYLKHGHERLRLGGGERRHGVRESSSISSAESC